MKIAICDDEKVIRQQLRSAINEFFAEYNMTCEIEEFSEGSNFVSINAEYDLVFMDYQFSSGNGIDYIRQVRKNNTKIFVIFLTSFSEYAIESIKLNTFRYIVKPVSKTVLDEALENFIKLYQTERKIIVPTVEKTYYIDTDEVMYIEAAKKNTIVTTVNNKHRSLTCISDYQSQINNSHFYRTHRSYIVNMRYVSNIEKKIITLTNGDIVFCSPKTYDEFIKNYMNYLKYKA